MLEFLWAWMVLQIWKQKIILYIIRWIAIRVDKRKCQKLACIKINYILHEWTVSWEIKYCLWNVNANLFANSQKVIYYPVCLYQKNMQVLPGVLLRTCSRSGKQNPIRSEERTENEVEFQTLLLHKQYKNKWMPGVTPLAPVPLRAKPEPEATALPVCHCCMQFCLSWSDSGLLSFQTAQQYCTRQWLHLPEWK